MADVFTILYSQTPGGTLFTSSLILPEQTTAYSYSKSCEFNVYCQHAKAASPDDAGSAIRNQPCSAGYFTAPDAAWVNMDDECYPYGYPSLFMSDMQVQSNSISAMFDYNEGWHNAISTVAWPGDQCISGWTTACSTTITDVRDSSTYPQAWCCPGGDWTCATTTADDDVFAPQRLCQSRLTDAQALYVNYSPPITVDGVARALWTASIDDQAPNAAATAFHNAFALQLTSPSNAQTVPKETATGAPTNTNAGGADDSSSPNQPTSAQNQNHQASQGDEGPALSTGAVAGIAVAGTIIVIGLLGGFIFLYRKRRLAGAQQQREQQQQQQQQPSRHMDDKPELDGHSAVAAGGGGSTYRSATSTARNSTSKRHPNDYYYGDGRHSGFVAELPGDSDRYELEQYPNNKGEEEGRHNRRVMAELRADDVLPAEADGGDFFPAGDRDDDDDQKSLVSDHDRKNNNNNNNTDDDNKRGGKRKGGVGGRIITDRRSPTDSPTVP